MGEARYVRPPAVAGRFYPADATALAEAVDRYVQGGVAGALPSVRALLVPHAGYLYSGPVAGRAYATLPRDGRIRTVYLLGPSHYHSLDMAGLSSADAFATPLGEIPVDRRASERLLTGHPLRIAADPAHAPEHSLEVQLPFLQRVLGDVAIVPILLTLPSRDDLARDLAARLRGDPAALLIVSTDLSHHHPYETAARLDRRYIDAVLTGDRAGVLAGEACGRAAVAVLVAVAAELGWTAHLLDLRNSGDTAGPRDAVVGYAAVAYTG